MLWHACRTCAATASGPPGSPPRAGEKSMTGIVRVTSSIYLTAIALKMFKRPPSQMLSRRRARIENVPQRVADQIERQHDHEDRQARQQHDVRAQDDELPAGGEHATPVRRRRLRTESEERQSRGGEDLRAHVETEGHDDRREQMRQHVAAEDDGVGGAERARGLDELALAQR